MTADAIKIFVEEARGVTIAEAAERLGLAFSPRGTEHPQPCPAAGGEDRFAFNTSKNTWNCRGCGVGGRDAIGMAAHVLGFDVKRRDGLLEACAAVLGRDIPEEGERESAGDRAARLARLEDRKRRNAEAAAQRGIAQADFREKERAQARGIVAAAPPLSSSSCPDGRLYLGRRCGAHPPGGWLRVSAAATYWHGQDERGLPAALHCGPAMVAPFVDHAGTVIGCHITWIDLGRPPKFRPHLVDPQTGAALPTKKMRGTKKGGVIPIAGQPVARRWLGAEGIENTVAFARWEGFRGDTFYFAAGDLGNMAGPADPASRFAHPELRKPDRNGRDRPVMVAGPVPLFRDCRDAAGAQGGNCAPDAMAVPDHVEELVLIADGDSERVMTAAAMARARARHARPGRLIPAVWPRAGTDFAAMLAGADEAFETGGAPA